MMVLMTFSKLVLIMPLTGMVHITENKDIMDTMEIITDNMGTKVIMDIMAILSHQIKKAKEEEETTKSTEMKNVIAYLLLNVQHKV
jgi:hypothetical protein